jgi:hypothetical protein
MLNCATFSFNLCQMLGRISLKMPQKLHTAQEIQDYMRRQSKRDPYKPSSKSKNGNGDGNNHGHGNGCVGRLKVAVVGAAIMVVEAASTTTRAITTLLVLCQTTVATQLHNVIKNKDKNKSKLHKVMETLLVETIHKITNKIIILPLAPMLLNKFQQEPLPPCPLTH